MYAMDDVWFIGRTLSEDEVKNLYTTNSIDGNGLTLPVAAAEEPVAEEPVVDEPAVEEPVADEPAVEEPVIDEPMEETIVTAPQTGDGLMIFAAISALSAAAFTLLRKKESR